MFNSRFFAQYLCVLLLAGLFAVGTANAQTGTRINPALQPNETVENYQITPDGKFAVFQISKNVDFETLETRLYSFELATHALKTLSPLYSGNRNFLGYQIAPNSGRVVYKVDQAADNRFDLYSVAITGGAQTKISRLVSNSGDATNFKISPDGTRVVYEYEQDIDNSDDIDTLYSVSITGSAATRLTSTQPEAAVGEFFFTPDSSRVVFEFSSPNDEVYGLYSIPVTGGQSALVTPKYYADQYAVTADSRSLVYITDFENDDIFELYSSPITGGSRTMLSQKNAAANEDVKSFQLVNGQPAAVYAYRNAADGSGDPDSFGIVTVSGDNLFNKDTNISFSASGGYAIGADNRSIVFLGTPQSNPFSSSELYSITVESNGEVRRLSNTAATPQRGVGEFKITPDGRRVVFNAYPNGGGGFVLYSTPVQGGAITKLSGNPPADNVSASVFRFELTADGARAVYTYPAQNQQENTSSNSDIFSNSVTGGSLRRAANNVDDDGFQNFFRIAGNNRVVFTRTTFTFNEETFTTTTMSDLFKATL